MFRFATRPTRHLLTWLLIAQLALESVTLSKSGSRRLFFSTVAPMSLHMSITWQENKTLRDTSSKFMAFYPLKLYKPR